MSKLIFILIFFLSCTKTTNKNDFVRASSATTNYFSSIEYVRVVDGDTIIVNLPDAIPDVFGKNIPVRIRHIDTPELKSSNSCTRSAAINAKSYTDSLLKNAKKIDLENVGRDKYFRLLSDILVDNISIGKILLDKGLAVPYEGKTRLKINWCRIK